MQILKFLAPLFFANCSVLKDRALAELKRRQELPPKLQWRALVLNLSSVTSIDSTSIQVCIYAIGGCRKSCKQCKY